MRYNSAEGESREYPVPPSAAGMRLDKFLAEKVGEASRSFLKRLIDDDLVKIGNVSPKPSLKLKGGEVVCLFLPELIEMSAEPEAIPLDVLFEDEDIIVINKRAGMVVHPSPGHETGTLVNALLHHCGDLSGIGGVLRPGIVHRLDRDTTGCLVAAKHDAAHHEMTEQFAARKVQKTYWAITRGVPNPPEGKVEGLIGRHPKNRQIQAMLEEGGRHSLTLYRTLENFGEHALVECDLKTGRTHQIRVHMKHVHAPLLCDADYGRGGSLRACDMGGQGEAVLIDRQALHAKTLSFTHPLRDERLEFEAPLPDDFSSALSVLRCG